MRRSTSSDRRAARSFTLTEMLVAVAVFCILGAILMGVVSAASRAMLLGQSRAANLQTLRAVSAIIRADMEAAVLPVDPSDQAGYQFVQDPANLDASLKNPDAAFWQAAVGTTSTNSDIASVGYFVMWDRSVSANPVAKLCRFYDESSDAANYGAFTNAGDGWITTSLATNLAFPTKANHYQGLLAENVIGFWLSFSAVTATGVSTNLSSPFRSRTDQRLPDTAILSFAFVGPATAKRIGPADVAVITNSYVKYVQTNAASLNAFLAALPASIRADTEIYTTRVAFRRAR